MLFQMKILKLLNKNNLLVLIIPFYYFQKIFMQKMSQ